MYVCYKAIYAERNCTQKVTFCDSIYVNYPEQVNSYRLKASWWLPVAESKGELERDSLTGKEFPFGW